MLLRIRVDTEMLEKKADAIDRIGAECERTAAGAAAGTNGLKDYGGQLPIKKNNMASLGQAQAVRNLLREDTEKLRKLAAEFERADQETSYGFAKIPDFPPPFVHEMPNVFWDPDTPDGTVTRPGDNDFGPSQDINIEELFPHPPFPENFFTYKTSSKLSTRLCGILTAFHMAGITDLADGFLIIINNNGELLKKLETNAYLSPNDIQELCALLGLKTGNTVALYEPTDTESQVFQDILDDGGKIMVAVNAICPPGLITDPNDRLGSGHWVSVERMWTDRNGTVWVEVYNPYNNQYEVYRWETLNAAMQHAGSTNSNPDCGFYIPVYP
jgi:hypothetical protein